MTDIAALDGELTRMVETAADEPALEAVRVAALGKKGSISALLATLGKLTPDERKTQGAAINALKDAVTAALASRRGVLKQTALEAQLKREALDLTLPVRPAAIGTGRPPLVTSNRPSTATAIGSDTSARARAAAEPVCAASASSD